MSKPLPTALAATLADRADAIAEAARELAAFGWTPATSSNFSMRIDDQLAAITISGRDKGKLPLTLKGGGLRGLNYTLPMASAQVKSAVLLAGLHAEGGVEVIEPEATRDHTERMLRAFGAEVIVEDRVAGEKTIRHIRLPEGQKLTGTHVAVPGDPSSAAFPLVAGLIVPGSEVTVEGVMLNELRTGLFTTLQEMGADLVVSNRRVASGEEVGDITARHSKLKGVVDGYVKSFA